LRSHQVICEWLNPTPHAIAVYASQRLSPVATQHSLPSGRYSLLGSDFHRLDRTSFAWRTHSITSSVAIRGTEFMERAASAHSALMLAARITLAHFSVSSAMNLPKSVGEPASAVPPRSASRAFMLGSARAALLSLWSTSARWFSGPPTQTQVLAS